jgi:hypothetical protein
MGGYWVGAARRDVVETMDAWHALKATPGGPPLVFDPQLVAMIDRLVSSEIMLLRAVEEVESRPWWRRRRYNPYAR